MRVVCPSCDAEGTSPGAACAKCGAKLVQVLDEADPIGSILDGRFEILARLGKGGMGTVFRAKQLSIGREVAVKIMDRRFDRDLAAVKRFLREARLASQLAHPNVVGIIDFGQGPDGSLYIAMELVRGRTLRDVVDRDGALSLPRIQRIGAQMCEALEAAHAVSIVHRDLKLDNVMVLDREHVKVLDFGLARSLAEPDSKATATGMIAGTPLYLPPEVAFDAAPPAPAQDAYALGVILGELSVGKPLWDATTMEALFAQKLQRSPRLDDVAPALRGLVERLIANAPEARPAIATVRAELASLSELPPPIALEATREVPSAAFKPPPGPTPPLELETAWVEQKRAKQELAADEIAREGHRRVPKWLLLAAIVLPGVLVTAFVVSRMSPGGGARPGEPPGSTDLIGIEIRAKPPAKISINGHHAGTTPLTIHVPRSSQPLLIDAAFRSGTVGKQVVPDHDQLVDFVP